MLIYDTGFSLNFKSFNAHHTNVTVTFVQCYIGIETSHLICIENQLTGFFANITLA